MPSLVEKGGGLSRGVFWFSDSAPVPAVFPRVSPSAGTPRGTPRGSPVREEKGIEKRIDA